MENKDLIIIALAALVIYLYLQQNNQPNISDNSQQIQELKTALNHYQTLYQKRVEKDLGYSKTKDLAFLTDQDQTILEKVQEFITLVENTESHSLDRNQMNEIERLADQITQPQVKTLANQVITDSAHILGHRNLLKKIAEKENELEQVRQKAKKEIKDSAKKITTTEQTIQDLNQKIINLQLEKAESSEELEEKDKEITKLKEKLEESKK